MLKMADGPVSNLPKSGMDAVAGYVNRSGIGITYPQVVAAFPSLLHLSITTDGIIANCADVEKGAMNTWSGYPVGYCSVDRINALVRQFGRPRKLWSAHYDPRFGAHICSRETCNYINSSGEQLITPADGTQWIDHGGWDESLLNDDFFVLQPIPIPSQEGGMPVSKLFEWNTEFHGFQVTLGVLWHKWAIGTPNPDNEDLHAFAVTAGVAIGAIPDQVPQCEIVTDSAGARWLTANVQDSNLKWFTFAQKENTGTWDVWEAQ